MNTAINNDESLIEKCQNGDQHAFELLLETHYDTLYRFAYQWCGSQDSAQDITQLVCMKLARNIKQFRFESSFTSWLYQLTINCAKDFYKSPKHHNTREEQHDDLDSVTGGQHDLATRRIHAQQILEHIGKLHEDLRDTIILVFAQGLNHKQAAIELDVKESTISWRVHEARKILKQTFVGSELESGPTPENLGGLA